MYVKLYVDCLPGCEKVAVVCTEVAVVEKWQLMEI